MEKEVNNKIDRIPDNVTRFLSIQGMQQWINYLNSDVPNSNRLRTVDTDKSTKKTLEDRPKDLLKALEYKEVYDITMGLLVNTTLYISERQFDIRRLFNLLGLDQYQSTIDDFIDLIYYWNNSDIHISLIRKEIKSYVSGLNNDELLNILKPFGYEGPIRKSCLTFAILTGSVGSTWTSAYNIADRYPIIKNYRPLDVWYIAKLYGIEESNEFRGPYSYIALRDEHPIEKYILFLFQGTENIDIISEKLGLIDGKTDIIGKKKYFLEGLKDIAPILIRPVGLDDPPDMMNLEIEIYQSIL